MQSIAVYLEFWCQIPCVLVQIALRFGAKYLAFWCKLSCVLIEFAVRFDANYSLFSIKTHVYK